MSEYVADVAYESTWISWSCEEGMRWCWTISEIVPSAHPLRPSRKVKIVFGYSRWRFVAIFRAKRAMKKLGMSAYLSTASDDLSRRIAELERATGIAA